VYKNRIALSNGPTTIGPSHTFFYLKPKILFLKHCVITKKGRKRTISKTGSGLPLTQSRYKGDLILCTKMEIHRNTLLLIASLLAVQV
jgi:hypothetical protein